MKRWNPYDIKVEHEQVVEFAKKHRISLWYSRMCLHIGLFLTNVEYFVTGKLHVK